MSGHRLLVSCGVGAWPGIGLALTFVSTATGVYA